MPAAAALGTPGPGISSGHEPALLNIIFTVPHGSALPSHNVWKMTPPLLVWPCKQEQTVAVGPTSDLS